MAAKPKVRIIPLGGLDEIGKNITVIEYENDIIVVDCGSIFPKDEMLGIDLVIPDVTYLIKNQEKIRGILITHGHEDHIGALPYVMKQITAPIYGTRLTLALIENKFKEHGIQNITLNTITAGKTFKIGSFTVESIKMSHSIAGALAYAIHSPAGTIIVTGDFKIDYTPIDNEIADIGKLAELGRKGVLALLCESTNVERPGYTMSERRVGETFNDLFFKAKGRIIIAMFASNIHRIQQVVDSALRFGRKVAFCGRSMLNVSKVAMQIGELKIPETELIELDDIELYDDNELVVLTTGSQGEPMSGLTRMAYSEHRKMEIKQSDMVIISATPIPGNEKLISKVINQLYRRGATVVYEALADVHVSGHACQEELKLIHAITKPEYFIPVHGEYRHLWHHAQLAESMGMNKKNIILAELGQVIELGKGTSHIAGVVPTGSVMVDGLGIGDVGNVVLRDRKHLSQDGLIIVVMAIAKDQGMLVSGPDIISRGFVYVREAEDLMEDCRNVVRAIMAEYGRIEPADWNIIKNRVRDDLHRYLYDKIKRNPMILPIIVEI